jgi:hypothetical protein
VSDLRRILGRLHAAYDYPVEIEFALNFPPDGAYRFNLLQCRPMQVRGFEGGTTAAAPSPAAPRLVVCEGAVIGPSRVLPITRLVYVVPPRYAELGQGERYEVARLIGKINQASRDATLLLMGPGRWGTRDPWLGIPVCFAEINHVAALGEIVAMRDNLIPDVSLGTHFINELVEMDMLYFALFPNQPGTRIEDALLRQAPNRLTDRVAGAARWAEVVRVIEPPPGGITLYADAEQQRVTVTGSVV